MQVKRFVADDMRSVMRIVKEEMGADAVILSNRVVDGKVEILAARDYDESLINKALDQTLVESKPNSAAAYYERAAAERALKEEKSERLSQAAYAAETMAGRAGSNRPAAYEPEAYKTKSYESKSYGSESSVPQSSSQASSGQKLYDQRSYDQELDDEGAYETTDISTPARPAVVEPVEAHLAQKESSAQGRAAASHLADQESTSSAEFSAQAGHQAAGLYQPPVSPFADSMLEMRDELKSLRAMIQNQQVLGEWNELATRHPLRVGLYKKLSELGLSAEVCKYLAKGLDSSNDLEQALQAALKQLVYQLPIADDDILNKGGVYAMVGPTGVGKTTTIAKLAARFAMQHGQRHVALISTDTYRIGAHEQLMTYGRLLGVPVHSAGDAEELQQLLHKLHDKKLILIDTAGMSQRDIGLSQQFSHLRHPSSRIKPYLVLSANAQISTLEEVMVAFNAASPVGCILTKVDEAASLGGVLSAVVKQHLAVGYVSTGQKVPEDIHPARAQDLVTRMLDHGKRHKLPVEEEFMASEFASNMQDLRL